MWHSRLYNLGRIDLSDFEAKCFKTSLSSSLYHLFNQFSEMNNKGPKITFLRYIFSLNDTRLQWHYLKIRESHHAFVIKIRHFCRENLFSFLRFVKGFQVLPSWSLVHCLHLTQNWTLLVHSEAPKLQYGMTCVMNYSGVYSCL